MEKEKLNRLEDRSGDKKYFTQIPNIIVNHSTAYEQSLYLIMKRLAGEGGHCYASLNFLAGKMGVHKTTVSKTIAKLLNRRWIKETDKTKVKGGFVRTFVIVDIWKSNMENYEGGAEMTTNRGGAVNDGSGAVVDRSGAQSDTKKKKSNIYKKKSFSSKKFFYKPLNLPMWKDSNGKWFVIHGKDDFRDFAGDWKKDVGKR